MALRDVAAALPRGFRFYPSDEELVSYYLSKKVANESLSTNCTLVDVDLHTCEPWQLPDATKLGENEWYFFSFKDRKYATGLRANRATKCGFWKATGKDQPVFDSSGHEVVGMRKTLVFYRERAPRGIKTGWVMHEFRLESPRVPPKEDWVLCRVYYKSKEVPFSEPGLQTQTNNIIGWSPDVDVSPTIQYLIAANLETQSYQENLQYFEMQHYNTLEYGIPESSIGVSSSFSENDSGHGNDCNFLHY